MHLKGYIHFYKQGTRYVNDCFKGCCWTIKVDGVGLDFYLSVYPIITVSHVSHDSEFFSYKYSSSTASKLFVVLNVSVCIDIVLDYAFFVL